MRNIYLYINVSIHYIIEYTYNRVCPMRFRFRYRFARRNTFPISAPVRANRHVSGFGTSSREQKRFRFRNLFAESTASLLRQRFAGRICFRCRQRPARTNTLPTSAIGNISRKGTFTISAPVRIKEYIADFGTNARDV